MQHLRSVLGFVVTVVVSLSCALAAGAVCGFSVVAILDGHSPSRGDEIATIGALIIGLGVVLIVFLTSSEAENAGSTGGRQSAWLSLKCALAGLGSIAGPFGLFRGRLWSVEVAVLALQGLVAGGSFPLILNTLSRWIERWPRRN